MKNSEFVSVKSDKTEVNITKTGAEICSIKNKNGIEFMWNANPEIWGSFAPVLFPVIGALKNGKYSFEGKEYTVPKHGFIRNNSSLIIKDHTENSVTFQYPYNRESLKNYPFKFEFNITFSVTGNRLTVNHLINNKGNSPMYFSLGGHPAFKCPLYENESYDDYYLQFEKNETLNTYLLNGNGLQTGTAAPLLNNQSVLPLKHSLFDNDALILKNLKSRNISLNHKQKGPVLNVEFNDFNYVGIWAKPNGNFVCIEPWLGITDHENTNSNFAEKEGIIKLNPKTGFTASYSIQILV
ncbi:aldose 1-epimerase family protein [Abyssalbus ytuae]|uniref:Aldose 1-epimerase family protein n=1 Tax=Abyssalbus ytuae TaxID=2926907 RepID=A0A9E6ZL30_9FLAO|nr:aldose 1-epimerase family protein [Abyssalbus ytuae]UOB17744.1 aldose 1-epimerase family protein [Abyssalbus ytuae]